MKYFLFLFLFSFSPILKAQQTDSIPFKKANTIIIHTRQTDSVNYHRFQYFLMDNDYSIEKKDNELMTIRTAPHQLKTHPGWSYTYFFIIRFHNKNITLKPFWNPNVEMYVMGAKSTNSAIRWSYAKGRGNVNHVIYIETKKMLEHYPHEKIMYERR